MRHCRLTYVTVFENFDLGETVLKKNGHFFIFFLEIFKILKIRDSSFVAILIIRHFIYKSIDRSQLHQWRRFP